MDRRRVAITIGGRVVLLGAMSVASFVFRHTLRVRIPTTTMRFPEPLDLGGESVISPHEYSFRISRCPDAALLALVKHAAA
jgi:hypothetical protein